MLFLKVHHHIFSLFVSLFAVARKLAVPSIAISKIAHRPSLSTLSSMTYLQLPGTLPETPLAFPRITS